MKKVLVGLFLTVFGLAMANITLADHNPACTMQYDPVCGTDGKTYGNACTAAAAHVPVAYAGECRADVACTKEYKPVCGEVQVQCITAPCYPVQQTFGNRCEANAAGATNIQEGTCESQSQSLVDTSWKLTSFNDAAAEGKSTLSFSKDTVSAKICNNMSGPYSVSGNVISVGPMMSTLMMCFGPVGIYESAFNLSGARYNILGKVLTIDTLSGDRFQWTNAKIAPLPPKNHNNNSWRRYGLIIWQLNQLAKLNGYDTVEEKKAMAADLLEKINQIMIVSLMTPLQNAKFVYIKNAVQFYYDFVGETWFPSL